jgi:2-polyprenyl-3-methyl-5-hydroxy-6-metoxy-1,4-benzoquinol methylase
MNITHSQFVDSCLITGQPVSKILDFGQHPYADTFVAENQLNLSEPVFPLQVNLCAESGSIQLGYVSHAEDRYNLYSYSYTSSNSATARTHWENYAKELDQKFPIEGFIVEIGSNDGYLLRQFQRPTTKILGIDSSAEMCTVANLAGVETINALFDQTLSQQIRDQHGPARLICANNVFNHANDPVAFARAVSKLLADDGVFVFEVPYWLSMIESGRFTDMVYHEHPSYFTVKMAWNVLSAAGLEIVDYDVVDYHGGSLRVVAQRTLNGRQPIKVEDAIARETQIGLFDTRFYEIVQRRFEQQRDSWLHNFYQLRLQEPEAVFIGVGAAAKANTWLIWHGLNKTHLKYVTDASAFKQGKYTPLSRIPIAGDEVFAQHDAPYALILSWNIGEGLKKAILNINPRTRFISQ